MQMGKHICEYLISVFEPAMQSRDQKDINRFILQIKILTLSHYDQAQTLSFISFADVV